MSGTIRRRFILAFCSALSLLLASAVADVRAGPQPKAFVSDPSGDTARAGPDIVGISADLVDTNLVVTATFASGFSLPGSGRSDELYVAFLFDSDGNHDDTPPRFSSELDTYCPHGVASPFGVDFLVEIGRETDSFSQPLVHDAFDVSAGRAQATYDARSVTVSVPLAAIGGGSAPIDVIVAAGPGNIPGNLQVGSDCAPKSTPLTAQKIAVGPAVAATGDSQAGATRTFRAPVAGTRYDWDLDGDGVVDRTGASSALDVTYPDAFAGNVSVIATAADGSRTLSTLAITTSAPQLTASATDAPTQVCGDGDAIPEPGETWRVPVRIANTGAVATNGGSALFAPKDRLDAALAGTAIDGKLVIENPLVDVGTLAAGASVDAGVTVTLARDAECGASYALAFAGGVDAVSSNTPRATPVATFALPESGQCQVYTGSCTAAPGALAKAAVTPRQGLYYNANRAGNGLSNFIIPVPGASPVYFGAWFTGAIDHTPTWYVIQGPLNGNVVVAPIYRFTRDVSASTFTVHSSVVGQAVVTMKSTERLALLWQIGSKAGIELMDYFVGGAAPSPNRTGAWYAAAESGWGQVIHGFVSGGADQLFTVDYLYDGAGEPRWVLGQGTDAQLDSGAAHLTFMVHCPGCPWIADWNSSPLSAGTATERFIDATHGRTTTSFTLPAPLAGTWTRDDLPIDLLTVPQ